MKDGNLPPYPRQVLTDNPNVVFFTGVAHRRLHRSGGPDVLELPDRRHPEGHRSPLPTQRASAASCFYGDADDGRIMVMGGGPVANNLVDIIDIDRRTLGSDRPRG